MASPELICRNCGLLKPRIGETEADLEKTGGLCHAWRVGLILGPRFKDQTCVHPQFFTPKTEGTVTF